MSKVPFDRGYFNRDSIDAMQSVEDKSVDLIFTSPPHISETRFKDLKYFRRFQSDFISAAQRVIKDDGFIVICQANHRYKGQIVSNALLYSNLLHEAGMIQKDEKIVYRRPPVGRRDLYRFTYQIMTVWTRKGTFKRAGDFLADTIIDNQTSQTGITHWTAEFCDVVIKALTSEGDHVLDPFAGTAPVLASAIRNNRNYLGFEMDADVYEKGRSAIDAEIKNI